MPATQRFHDRRLNKGGLAQLAKLLASLIRDHTQINVVVDEADLDVSEIIKPGLSARDQWSGVIRAADATNQGLLRLLTEVRERIGENDRPRLDEWLARGMRTESMTEAVIEIVANTRRLASFGDPRNPQVTEILKALRGAAQDLAAGLADRDTADSFLIREDDIEVIRANCIAAARRARTAADALAVGIKRATALAASAPRGQAPDVTFAQQRNIDIALFDDQEAVEASFEALITELRIYTVDLLPDITQSPDQL